MASMDPIALGVTITADAERDPLWDWLWRRLLAPLPTEAEGTAEPAETTEQADTTKPSGCVPAGQTTIDP
jgi:hypothetical protein